VPPGDASTPLDQPYYGASIGVAFTRFWKKYVIFHGRASRSEFWWWFLISVIVSGVLSSLGNHSMTGQTTALGTTFSTLQYLWGLATLIPGLALFWRRMHDTNRSGLNIFWGLIPIVGAILLIVFAAGGSKPEGARFDR